MENNYNLIDHTADYGLEFSADTLEEAFITGAMVLNDIIFKKLELQPQGFIDIEIEAEDTESLFVKWLNEIIYYIDGEDKIIFNIDITDLNETHLKTTCNYMDIDSNIHNINKYIKGVTYYDLSLEVKKDEVKVKFFFDV